jgi:hypothetical protein
VAQAPSLHQEQRRLQAYHPMGLEFYGRRRSRFMIETVLAH